jgi:uncharacterized membrane protein
VSGYYKRKKLATRGDTLLQQLFHLIGFAVCHQLPERSIHFGGRVLPVCARETGIYLGFLFSFVFLALVNRKREYGFPPLYVLIFALVGIALMAIDGFTSYAGWRSTTNSIRLLTGILAGSALPLVLLPIFNYQAWSESTAGRVIKNGYQFAAFVISLFVLFLLVESRFPPLFLPFSLTVTSTIIFAFFYINLILVMLIPVWTKKAKRLRDLAIPFLIATALTALELTLSYNLHRLLLSRIT